MSKTKTSFPFFRPYYSMPITVKSAQATKITDINGKSYLDGYAGVATLNLGHCHPEVDNAVKKQLDKFGHISHIFINPLEQAYSQKLLNNMKYSNHKSEPAKVNPGLNKLFFLNSGSEGVDLALCLARQSSKAETPPLITALDRGYHGGSWLSKSVTGLTAWHFSFGAAPGIDFVQTPLSKEKENIKTCLTSLENSFKRAFKLGSRPILIIEPVLGVGGIIIPPEQWFSGVSDLISKYNAILICDEVQTGFGRCGKTLFAFQKYFLTPDIVVLGKSIANGYPLAALAATDEISRLSKNLLHFNTFGGHPASIAAADKCLDILIEQNLSETTEQRGFFLLGLLLKELDKYKQIKEIRGTGYLIAIEMQNSKQALEIMDKSAQKGLLIGVGGRDKNVLRLEPALIFDEKEIEKTTAILKNIFSSL